MLLVAMSSYHTCVSNVTLTPAEGNPIKMHVASQVDKQIEVQFILGEGREEVNLADYSLRLVLPSTEGTVKYYIGTEEHQDAGVQRRLVEFAGENETSLNLGRRVLIVPFKVVPGMGINKVKVKFELVDSSEQVIGRSKKMV